jgi:hypothetical protein
MPIPNFLVKTTVPPVAPPRAPREAIPEAIPTREQRNLFAGPDQSVHTVHAFVSCWDDAEAEVNSFATKPRYVIIGNGFAATVDHATLRQTKFGVERIGGKEVLHIGYPDPWGKYHPHDMNQYLELLTLPGYKNQAVEADVTASGRGRWLWSPHFAKRTAEEIETIKEYDTDTKVLPGQVLKIEKTAQNFRIFVRPPGARENQAVQVLASKIDICTGPGQTRVAPNGPGGFTRPEELETEYTSPPGIDADDWYPQLITASSYTRENAKTIAGGLVLVTGAGPAAAQAVERALEEGAGHILWTPSSIHQAFPPTLRLDDLVKVDLHPAVNRWGTLPVRLGFPAGALKLVPARDNVWITEKEYRIIRIEYLTAEKILERSLTTHNDQPLLPAAFAIQDGNARDVTPLLVTFARDGYCIGSDGVQTQQFHYGVFHQVVTAKGLQDTVNEPGSAFMLLKDLISSGSVTLEPIIWHRSQDCALGLQSTDGRIRLLGASGHGNKLMKSLAGGPTTVLESYQSSLPAQARIALQGVTVSGVTIAHANRYFPDKTAVNPNVNTAMLRELKDTFGDRLGKLIHTVRSYRIRPFEDAAFLKDAVFYAWKNNLENEVASGDHIKVINDDDELTGFFVFHDDDLPLEWAEKLDDADVTHDVATYPAHPRDRR